jgi:hypothetical protein
MSQAYASSIDKWFFKWRRKQKARRASPHSIHSNAVVSRLSSGACVRLCETQDGIVFVSRNWNEYEHPKDAPEKTESRKDVILKWVHETVTKFEPACAYFGIFSSFSIAHQFPSEIYR